MSGLRATRILFYMDDHKFKYNEDQILNDALEYIKNTYSQHYVNPDATDIEYYKQLQCIDLIASSGHYEGFCVGDVLKYVSRYGKKNGKNKKDIYKAIHYLILLLYFDSIFDNQQT